MIEIANFTSTTKLSEEEFYQLLFKNGIKNFPPKSNNTLNKLLAYYEAKIQKYEKIKKDTFSNFLENQKILKKENQEDKAKTIAKILIKKEKEKILFYEKRIKEVNADLEKIKNIIKSL